MPYVAAVIFAAMLFGTTGTTQALGPEGVTPISVSVVRLVLGGTILALAGFGMARRRVHARANPRLIPRTWILMAVTGVCLAAYQPLFFLGTARNGVAVGTVIALGAAPVLAGILEWFFTRRLPARPWWIATALAATGVALLGFAGGTGGGGTDPAGLLGSLGAGACFAIYANAQRQLLEAGFDPYTVAGAMGLGAAVCGAAMIPLADLSWAWTPHGLVVAGWLGLATIALAYVLFTWGLEKLSAATAATLTLAEPLTAGLLGVALLGERLAALAVLGLVVLAVGLVVLAVGSRRPKPFPLEG